MPQDERADASREAEARREARAAPGELTKGLGDSLKIGSPPKGTLKGGGAIVQSTAPRPTKKLTEAEMEANWEKLCAEMG